VTRSLHLDYFVFTLKESERLPGETLNFLEELDVFGSVVFFSAEDGRREVEGVEGSGDGGADGGEGGGGVFEGVDAW